MTRNQKISITLNLIIFACVLICVFWAFSGFTIMYNPSEIYSGSSIFKFFTTDSNILMGFAAGIMAIFQMKQRHNKNATIPKWAKLLYFAGVVSVTLTFLTVVLFLTPTIDDKISLYTDTNLFFHVVVPLLAITNLEFFMRKLGISGKQFLFGVVPMFIYSIFYTANCLTHIENGIVNKEHDFYGFLLGGLSTTWIAIIVMFVATTLISFILYKINNR